MTKTTFIKQYGEMRTATNLVKLVLEDHCSKAHVYANGLGWKHGSPRLDRMRDWVLQNPGKSLKTMVCTRDPYSWIYGIIDAAITGRLPHAHALQGEWEQPWQNSKLHAKLMKRWNLKHRAWLSKEVLEEFYPPVLIRYEDLVKDQAGAITKLANDLGLKLDKPVKPITANVGANRTVKKAEFDRDFYLQKKYLKKLPASLVTFITENVDGNVLKLLGYETPA